MVVKAAGCNKDEMILDDSLYEADKLPVGTRVFPKIADDSYWEKECSSKEAEFELFKIAMYNEI